MNCADRMYDILMLGAFLGGVSGFCLGMIYLEWVVAKDPGYRKIINWTTKK